MFRRLIVLVGLAMFAPSAWAADAASSPARPNILFILADDYGLDGVGCYGSDNFKTPNIDAMARTGLRFENCYCTPLCGPTRCEFITGRYAFRTGGLTNGSAGNPAPDAESSIARMMKQTGYATGQAGKWRQMGATPGDWGFDEYITDPTASGYFWQKSYTRNGQLVELGKEVYYPDVTHQFALDFIQRHRNEPFFFYYASHLVHGPILRTPDTKPGVEDPNQLYADNVAYLDKQVGELMAHLDRLGLREKTLVIFTADNGTAKQSRTIGGRQIYGQKGTMLEGGAHVPMIANWKGTAPEGTVLKDLVDFTDFYVTFAELAGATLSGGVILDGHSLAAQFQGRPGQPREWIYVQLGNQWYVREPQWKMNHLGELFDMTDAPFAEKPVAADAQQEAARAARERLQAVLDKLGPAAGKKEPAGPGRAKPGKKVRKKLRNLVR